MKVSLKISAHKNTFYILGPRWQVKEGPCVVCTIKPEHLSIYLYVVSGVEQHPVNDFARPRSSEKIESIMISCAIPTYQPTYLPKNRPSLRKSDDFLTRP